MLDDGEQSVDVGHAVDQRAARADLGVGAERSRRDRRHHVAVRAAFRVRRRDVHHVDRQAVRIVSTVESVAEREKMVREKIIIYIYIFFPEENSIHSLGWSDESDRRRILIVRRDRHLDERLLPRNVGEVVSSTRSLTNAATGDQPIRAVVDEEDFVEVVGQLRVSGLAFGLGRRTGPTVVDGPGLRGRLDEQTRVQLVQPVHAADVHAARVPFDDDMRNVH